MTSTTYLAARDLIATVIAHGKLDVTSFEPAEYQAVGDLARAMRMPREGAELDALKHERIVRGRGAWF
jgi:hypothetical protein